MVVLIYQSTNRPGKMIQSIPWWSRSAYTLSVNFEKPVSRGFGWRWWTLFCTSDWQCTYIRVEYGTWDFRMLDKEDFRTVFAHPWCWTMDNSEDAMSRLKRIQNVDHAILRAAAKTAIAEMRLDLQKDELFASRKLLCLTFTEIVKSEISTKNSLMRSVWIAWPRFVHNLPLSFAIYLYKVRIHLTTGESGTKHGQAVCPVFIKAFVFVKQFHSVNTNSLKNPVRNTWPYYVPNCLVVKWILTN